MLLGIENAVQMSRDPLRGNLFENMVVADLRKQRLNMGRDAGLFTLRTEKGFEIDVISKAGRCLRPIEIKSAATYRPEFANNLLRFSETRPKASTRPSSTTVMAWHSRTVCPPSTSVISTLMYDV